MKLYAETNKVDPDWVDIYYYWMGKKTMFASVCSDQFDKDIQERLVVDEQDLVPTQFELRLV